MGVKPLSWVVREELQRLDPADMEETAAEKQMRELFSSKEFAAGLAQLWEDQAARDQNFSSSVELPSAREVAHILSQYRLSYVSRIYTRLLLANGKDVTKQSEDFDDMDQSFIFVGKDKIIHISNYPSPLRKHMLLAHSIKKIIEEELPRLGM